MLLNALSDAFTVSPLDDVDTFIDFLSDCSLDDWMSIGARSSTSARPAVTTLQEILVAHDMSVDGWLACDSIETLVFLASCSRLERRPIGRAMERSRLVAEQVALAILARPWLAPADFDELVSPVSDRSAMPPLRAA